MRIFVTKGAKIQVISKLIAQYDTHNQMLQEKGHFAREDHVELWEQAVTHTTLL